MEDLSTTMNSMTLGFLISIHAVLCGVVCGQPPSCTLRSPAQVGYLRDGDILIGGFFPVWTSWKEQKYSFTEQDQPITCTLFGPMCYSWMQAMAYAINEINTDNLLLPNVTLGFQIFDSCTNTARALWGTFWTLTGEEHPIPNYQCNPKTPVAIVGDALSLSSIAMASLLGAYVYPQVSYISSLASLSKRYLYPSFFRTIPSDDKQARALAKLVSHMGWNWVGLLSLDEDYGILGSQILKEELQNLRVCLAYHETFGLATSPRELERIADVVTRSSAKAVIIYSRDPFIHSLIDLLLEREDSKRIWLATEGWSNSAILQAKRYSSTMTGTLALSLHEVGMYGFKEYLLAIRPSTALPQDIFIESFWESVQECHWPNSSATMENGTVWCTGQENLTHFRTNQYVYDEFDFKIHYLVYNAVYAVAQALHDVILSYASTQHGRRGNRMAIWYWEITFGKCRGGRRRAETYSPNFRVPSVERSVMSSQVSVFNVAHCASRLAEAQWVALKAEICDDMTLPRLDRGNEVTRYLKKVHFINRMGDEIYFDANGNPPTDYDILNWQRDPDGSIRFVKAGRYNLRDPQGKELSINASAIKWITGDVEIPHSVCSDSCSPGFRKAPQKGRPMCCFDCVPCSEGHISSKTDSSDCTECPSDMWPNENQTMCVPKVIEFLSYWEPLGITLTSAVIFCSFTTIGILGIFIKYKDSAIVKANNRDVTYLLLTFLTLSFLCSLLFIGQPHKLTCRFRQGAFGVIFAFSVSCVLAKTLMVVIAFRATKPGSNMRKWLGPRVPAATISICIAVQLFICMYWMFQCPPFPEVNMKVKTGVLVFQCNECSDTLLWCMLGYMAFLSCISFLVAFLARNLPDSFNEAKWITFSMLIFLSVWISFVPAYLSTQGKFMVAVEVFGILSSSAGIVGCIFFPKCYIILLRPELNTHQNLLGKRTFQKTNN
ncbi:extracellular calcium-sensing receptor-like [Hyperolius riggenbachi]|uniref:extracellular calcium-sensing receptor-like n=1 Tax=Hyperolius riggenbachi TaxID=752182 RepID=UPI0035A3D0FB